MIRIYFDVFVEYAREAPSRCSVTANSLVKPSVAGSNGPRALGAGESAATDGVATPQPICVNCLCVVEDFKDAATGK